MFEKKPPASGMEMMLKSMGLGPIIEMAQQLANEKTVEKILKFADGLEDLNARLARIEQRLASDHGSPEPRPNTAVRGPQVYEFGPGSLTKSATD